MVYGKSVYTLICLYLCCTFHVISAQQVCDKSKCKGPVKYYEDLQCTPIYGADDSCCAVKYNCDHLKGRSRDKCYFKGHVYEASEILKAEDAKPCDVGCFCSAAGAEPAHFTCAIVDCFARVSSPECYLKASHNQCCSGPEVCPQNGTEIARCEVDGKTYLDGQRFTPNSDSTLSCICAEGYTGENVAPFCEPSRPHSCDTELRRGTDVYNNCAPTYYSSQNPATDCHIASKCQNEDDRVVEVKDTADPDLTCTFGELTLKIGEELNRGTDSSSCYKCVCEIPPVVTCQQLLDGKC